MQRPRGAKPRTSPPADLPLGGADAPLEAYVLAASFLTGAIVLVVEILGTRVVSPYYGASVYVWSAAIGVTLGSLTVGYVAGGWAADRWPPLVVVALATTAGAFDLLLVPGLLLVQ